MELKPPKWPTSNDDVFAHPAVVPIHKISKTCIESNNPISIWQTTTAETKVKSIQTNHHSMIYVCWMICAIFHRLYDDVVSKHWCPSAPLFPHQHVHQHTHIHIYSNVYPLIRGMGTPFMHRLSKQIISSLHHHTLGRAQRDILFGPHEIAIDAACSCCVLCLKYDVYVEHIRMEMDCDGRKLFKHLLPEIESSPVCVCSVYQQIQLSRSIKSG